MKIAKMMILALTICSLLIVSSMQIAALEKSGLIEDVAGDVFSFDMIDYSQIFVTENEYIDIDNIDIREVEYTITDDTVEFSLTVEGIIEDRGSFEEMDFETVFSDTIAYNFLLNTDSHSYRIDYVNESCQMTKDEYNITNLTDSDFTVNNDVLTVAFNLDSTEEAFVDVNAQTIYIRLDFLNMDIEDEESEDSDSSDFFTYIGDMAPNGPLTIIDAIPDVTTAIEDTPVNFTGIAMDGALPHEYYWEFGDGETSTEKNPVHIYDEPGEYEYTLTVTDQENTQDTASGNIEILESEDGEDTPGFEFVIALAAIGCIFLWKRKRYP